VNKMRSSRPLLFVLLSWLSIPDAWAQSSGKFVATGSMAAARVAPTATLLKDGRVLIAGGFYASGSTDGIGAVTAELYDPSTGIFTPTGRMTGARSLHAAVLLPDGRVLIAGGESSIGLSSAELYDPATGTFTPTGDMNSSHSYPVASLLSNGKVLISGAPSAELYDPATGVFTPAGPVRDGSSGAVLLKDGRVLIASSGGVSLYDITGDSLRLTSSLPGNKYGENTVTLLGDGRVLIAGGNFSSYEDVTNEASLYDPRRGTLENTGHLQTPRAEHTATLLPGGRVLIVGGYDGSYLNVAEEYDPSTGSFTYAAFDSWGRDGNTATLLPDGRVLITGGDRSINMPAELFIPPLRAASAASLSGPLAPASLASLFGSRLALTTEAADPLSPPTSLGGISLRVHDSSGAVSSAPLLYVSPTQINFEVPAETAPGTVTLEVVNAPAQPPPATARVDRLAPGLFAYDDNTAAAYALRFEPNGKPTMLSVRNTIVLDDRPVYLVLYATGLRNRSSLANVQCSIGGASVPLEYAGPEGSGAPGLDQVNVRLTPALKGLGVANLVLTVDGVSSNAVSVDIR